MRSSLSWNNPKTFLLLPILTALWTLDASALSPAPTPTPQPTPFPRAPAPPPQVPVSRPPVYLSEDFQFSEKNRYATTKDLRYGATKQFRYGVLPCR